MKMVNKKRKGLFKILDWFIYKILFERVIRKNLSRLVVGVIRGLNKFDAKVLSYSYKMQKLKSLTAKDNVDEDGKYSERLREAIINKDIKNIALTGPYGSGKSSILRSFEKKSKENRYLNISLASFKDSEEGKGIVIERSIFQQILYKERGEKLPFSRFSRIKNMKNLELIGKTLFYFIWILSILSLYKINLFENVDIFLDLYREAGIKIIINICFSGIVLLFMDIFRGVIGLRLSKVSLKNIDIDLCGEKEKSILNKHLDEIMYFFEVSKYNVVVIEDLDRLKGKGEFKTVDIFTKLREINLLINNSEQIKRKITFIYALKDNMFEDEERTKFFDVIIPVIPVINNSNAAEKLLEEFPEAKNLLDKKFIREICIFINDMRLLINIYNEFLLYKENLSISKDELKKLFGLIVYKNIYPNDFADLHEQKGILNDCFENKKKYIKDEIKNKEKEISSKNIEIKNLKMDKEIKEKEYIKACVFEIIKAIKIIPQNVIKIKDKNITFWDLEKKESFLEFLEEGTFRYRNNYGWNNYSSGTLRKEVEKDYSIEERIKRINQEGIEELKLDIQKIEEEIEKIKKYNLKQLINYNEAVLFKEETGKKEDKKVLKFLLNKGYIDEEYYKYISRFHKGSLNLKDSEFVKAVLSLEKLDYEYKLNDKEEIIERIDRTYFNKKEILNYDLFEFIIKNINKYEVEYETIIQQILKDINILFKFIDGFLENTDDKSFIIRDFCKRYNEIWNFIENHSNFTKQKKEKYLTEIIDYAKIEDILKINEKSEISFYVANLNNFFNLEVVDKEKRRNIVKELDIKFKELNIEKTENEDIEFVYENNLYDINVLMVEKIIKYFGINIDENILIFKTKNYSCILNSECEYLIEYIKSNIDYYIENIFLKLENNKSESLENLIEILNNPKVKKENKEEIIELSNTKIKYLNDIPEELWDKVLSELKIEINLKNIIAYFRIKEEVKNSLIELINKEDKLEEITQEKEVIERADGELLEKIYDNLVMNSKLSYKSFFELEKMINFEWSNLNLKELSKDKVELLLTRNRLHLTQENIDFVKNYDKSFEIKLIENNLEKYLEKQNELKINKKSYFIIFKFDNLNYQNKIKFINNLDYSLLKEEKEFLKEIINLLLEYKKETNFEIKNIEELFDYSDVEYKIKLFLSLEIEDEQDIKIYLKKFGEPYLKLSNKKQDVIDKTEINKLLLENLKMKGYISSYKKDKKKEDKYRIFFGRS